jgi:membrane-bound lytic murein transglycosylase B
MRIRPPLASAVAVALVAVACGGSAGRGGLGAASDPPASPSAGVASTSPLASPMASPTGAAASSFVPRPNAPLPSSAAALAADAERATRAVRRSVEAWAGDGTSAWPPPHDLVLQALYQQRIYRLLAQRPSLAGRVLPRLPGSIRREAESIVRANADVFAHANPVPPSYTLRTRAPEPADALLAYYRAAERRFGVPWDVLAAVNYVETKFGRVVSNSYAGAQGPMQFLPSTWAAYGLGGDIRDPHDAILGAANYLHANGAPEDLRGALWHYNPVASYVDAVATYASAIRRDPRLYYVMYCWQVYVLTTRGDERVTGPGL